MIVNMRTQTSFSGEIIKRFEIGALKASDIMESLEIERMTKNDAKKLKKLAVSLWTTCGVFFAKSYAFAESGTGLWREMGSLFAVFQEIGMVIGAFAILAGLIVMFFKKRMAIKVISTSAVIVGGVFLVPAAIMLIAIIGSALNGALTTVFEGMDLGGSVKVGGAAQ